MRSPATWPTRLPDAVPIGGGARRHGRKLTAGLVALALIVGCGTGDAQDLPRSADTTPSVADARDPSPAADPQADPSPDDALVVVDTDVPPSLPVTVTDARGEQVTVEDVSRIVPLSGSLAEIVYSLGLGDRLVARDVGATFPEVVDLPVVTDAHAVSAEGVLSTRPSVVLADGFVGPPEALQAIERAGVPVVIVDEAWTLEDIAPRIEHIARSLGVPEAGDALVAHASQQVIDARPDDLPGDRPPRVAFLYLRGSAAVQLLGGEGSGADAMIAAVGGIDAGTEAGLGSYTPITSEALVAAAPDVILVMDAGLDSVGGVDGLVKLPGVAQTPAGRDRRVITMDDALLLSFGPRTGEALHELGDKLVAVLTDTSHS